MNQNVEKPSDISEEKVHENFRQIEDLLLNQEDSPENILTIIQLLSEIRPYFFGVMDRGRSRDLSIFIRYSDSVKHQIKQIQVEAETQLKFWNKVNREMDLATAHLIANQNYIIAFHSRSENGGEGYNWLDEITTNEN